MAEEINCLPLHSGLAYTDLRFANADAHGRKCFVCTDLADSSFIFDEVSIDCR